MVDLEDLHYKIWWVLKVCLLETMVDVEDLPYKKCGFIWICRIYIIYI